MKDKCRCGKEIESDSLHTVWCKTCCGQTKLEEKIREQTIQEMNKRIDDYFRTISLGDMIRDEDNTVAGNVQYSKIERIIKQGIIKSLKGYCSRCIAQTNGSNVCNCGEKE